MNNYKTNHFFYFLSILIFSYSCSTSQKTKPVNLKKLNDSLKVAIDKLTYQNDSIARLFKEKLLNEKKHQIAELWVPKADYLQYKTDRMYKFIDNIITNLNTNSINSDSLYSQLNFLKCKIIRIDSEIFEFIEPKSEIITHSLDSLKQSNNEIFHSYFNDKSTVEQLIFLRQIILNIKLVENEILLFCNNKIK